MLQLVPLVAHAAASDTTLQASDKLDLIRRAGTPILRKALCGALKMDEAATAALMREPYVVSMERPTLTQERMRQVWAEAARRDRDQAGYLQDLRQNEVAVVVDEIIGLWCEDIPKKLGVEALPLMNRNAPVNSLLRDKLTELVIDQTPPAPGGVGAGGRISFAMRWWDQVIRRFYGAEYLNGTGPRGNKGSLEWLATRVMREVRDARGQVVKREQAFEYFDRLMNGAYDEARQAVGL